MNHNPTKYLTLRIAGFQSFYWMVVCCIASFASVFLLARNITNSEIGVILAVANIVTAVIQPTLGSLADKNPCITLKGLITWIVVINLIIAGALVFIQGSVLAIAILFGAAVAFTMTIHPLMNSLIFEFVNDGRNINYGVTRGIGSISFAVASYLLGLFVDPGNPVLLMLSAIGLYIGILILVRSLPLTEAKKKTLALAGAAARGETGGFIDFLKKYERFPLLLLGLLFLFIFHTITNTYLVQIIDSLGGKESDFGLALTIAAVCELPVLLGYSVLATRFKSGTMLKAAGVFYVLRSILFFGAGSVGMIIVAQLFQALSFALYVPSSVYYINKIMRNEDKVKGQTLVVGATTVGTVFGSVCGGWLLDNAGVSVMLAVGVAATVIACGLLFFSIRGEAAPVEVPPAPATLATRELIDDRLEP